MVSWWNGLDLLRQILYIIAIPSTVILLLQTILLFFGMGDGDADINTDTDVDIDIDTDFEVAHDFDCACDIHDTLDNGNIIPDDVTHGPGYDGGLRLFTMRGLIALFSIGGWSGIALLDIGLTPLLSAILAVCAGFVAMLLIALVLRATMKMHQSGNINFRNALGLVGEVYVPIPEDGKGKVTIIVQERFLELDAVTNGPALKYGQQVRVKGVTENNVLVVAALN